MKDGVLAVMHVLTLTLVWYLGNTCLFSMLSLDLGENFDLDEDYLHAIPSRSIHVQVVVTDETFLCLPTLFILDSESC